jgi:hypothetical protein
MWLIVLPLDVPTLTTSLLPKRSWQSDLELYINLILDVPTFTTSRLPRDPSSQRWNYVGEKWPLNFAWNARLPRSIQGFLHAVNLRHGTEGFTSPKKEGVLRIFSPWKIRRIRPGLNPRTWVPKASVNLKHVQPIREHQKFKSRVVTSIRTTDFENFLQSENI